MSGHSKWANNKAKKEKGDAQRARIFTKIAREIGVAVRASGADPDHNSKLYDIILKARANNMPNDNIARSIKKAAGDNDGAVYESLIYEGYGVGGSAVIVDVLTDKKNRTAGDLRHLFDKYGGSMGTTNCALIMFDKKGVIVCKRPDGASEDDIYEIALDSGCDDVLIDEEVYEVYTAPSDLNAVRVSLEQEKQTVMQAEIAYMPNNTVDLTEENLERFTKMIELMEDNDDVQNVYHNVNLPEEPEEE
ncbi:MAG: YebC/PmpR family DNA-binding transcriptional regulator [Clostridia bacterium]|nr:YebC/PmpR family DNA-binding transcriptional regulator [Clostridia bacterium]